MLLFSKLIRAWTWAKQPKQEQYVMRAVMGMLKVKGICLVTYTAYKGTKRIQTWNRRTRGR
jgi:hypothetical protein